MKTPEEILDSEFATQNLTGMVRDGVIDAMRIYANQLEGRVNALEEWLTEYCDELQDSDIRHNKNSVISAINELLYGDEKL